jgi:hypothetical protein
MSAEMFNIASDQESSAGIAPGAMASSSTPRKGKGLPPPVIMDDWTIIRTRREIQVWQMQTDIELPKQAAAFSMAQTGVRREHLLEVLCHNVGRFDQDHGIDEVLIELEADQPDEAFRFYETWERFTSLRKIEKEGMPRYISRVQSTANELKAIGMVLPEQIHAMTLIQRANLDKAAKRTIVQEAGWPLKVPNVETSLRRHHHLDGTSNNYSAHVAGTGGVVQSPIPISEARIQAQVSAGISAGIEAYVAKGGLRLNPRGSNTNSQDATNKLKAERQKRAKDKRSKQTCSRCNQRGHYPSEAHFCPKHHKHAEAKKLQLRQGHFAEFSPTVDFAFAEQDFH